MWGAGRHVSFKAAGGLRDALRSEAWKPCPVPVSAPKNEKRPVGEADGAFYRGRAVDSLWGVRGWTFPSEMTNPPPLRNLKILLIVTLRIRGSEEFEWFGR